MTRWAWRTAAAIAVLAALYAAAGWFLAPRYLRGELVQQAAARGYDLRLGKLRIHPFALSVEIEDASLQPVAAAQAITVDLAWASLWRDAWIVERVELRAPRLDLTGAFPEGAATDASPLLVQQFVVADGTLQLPRDTVLENVRISLQDLSTAPGAAPARYEASAAPASGGTLKSQGTVSLEPLAARGTLGAQAIALAKVVQIPGAIGGTAAYAYEKGKLAFHDIALRAEPEAGGEVRASGQWDVAAGHGRLELRAEALPAALAQRFLPEALDARIASGTVSSNGVLDMAEGFSYAGSAAVAGLRLEERGSKQLLLAWREARTPALRVTRESLSLGRIEAEGPEARLVVREGGRFNFAEAFAREGKGGAKAGFRVGFERLQVRGGILHFADRSLENPFETTVVDLGGTVTGFSTAPGDAAQVQLNGRVQPYGTARIRGTIDLGAPTSLASFTARLRNLRLEAFNPYVARFAGYRIASGRVSAQLRYDLKDGRLLGRNDLVFEEMRLGEKVASRGALDLPLELAVALLADAEGRIALDIPVSGDLRDPKFDFGALVARAVGNTLKRIVTAPFRALASLVGASGDGLGAIAFAPGRAELSPPAQEDVIRVAEALASRPRLAIAVHAGYDAERDLRALQRRAAGDEVAARAGVDPRGPLDFTNGRVRRAAEQIFLRRGGSREELSRLRQAGGDYGRELVRRIAGALPIGETSVDVLAQARAETVRDALIERGLDPQRVRIDAPHARPAKEGGVATELALFSGS